MMAEKAQTQMYKLPVHDVLNSTGKGSTQWPFSVTKTDLEGWRFVVDGANDEPRRHIWRYLKTQAERKTKPLDPLSRFYLGLPQEPAQSHTNEPATAPSITAAVRRAALFHSRLQSPAGCWTADLSCIFFVKPMLIIAWYITGLSIPEAHAIALATHAFSIQASADGGWPTYLDQKMPRGRESVSTLFGTLLMYVALRLLGVSADDGRMAAARDYVLRSGGAAYMPCWGKFWLCLLGMYGWEGSDPYPSEMWLLPAWFPVSPWRWYCFPRQIYLPMTYLWEKKYSCPSNPLLDAIREEIFVQSDAPINFLASRATVLSYQRQIKKTWVLLVVNWLLTNIWLRFLRPQSFARKAQQKALQLVCMADDQTKSTSLCVIDACLNMIAIHAAAKGAKSKSRGSNQSRLERMQKASLEYFFMNSLGGQSQSIHGGHAWDTAFALQTLAQLGFGQDEDLRPTMLKAYAYLAEQQHLTDYPNSPPINHPSRLGGFPFTTKYHSWVCSDCTGESLKALLLARKHLGDPPGETQRGGKMTAQLRLAVDNLLMIQSPSGGYSTFEPRQAGEWLETLNGTELFGKAIVEYDYVECTASAVTALQEFRKEEGSDAQYRGVEVQQAIDRGIAFLIRTQRRDGSWLGEWGVAFTYGAFFALEALGGAGRTYEYCDTVRRGCEFLLSKQMEDGGWGETMQSIVDRVYTQAKISHTVQTAWCCLALMHASYPHQEPIRRGIKLILSRQKPDGEWPQEQGVGAGIMTTQILYHNYIFHFPMRALHRYAQLYGDALP